MERKMTQLCEVNQIGRVGEIKFVTFDLCFGGLQRGGRKADGMKLFSWLGRQIENLIRMFFTALFWGKVLLVCVELDWLCNPPLQLPFVRYCLFRGAEKKLV